MGLSMKEVEAQEDWADYQDEEEKADEVVEEKTDEPEQAADNHEEPETTEQ
jgi:hypothetical protein